VSFLPDDRASELRELFFESAAEILQNMNEAGLALEDHPTDKENLRSVRRAVHTLKGDSAACGFRELSELAHELEMDRAEVIEGLVAGSSYNTLSIDSGGNSSGDEEARAIADTLGDVDTGLERIENREALRPLLEGLPERERTVLVLRFFDSMTQTQIAERVGISQMHVSRLLAKSLARLRDELE